MQFQHVEVLDPLAVPVTALAADLLVAAGAERQLPGTGQDDHTDLRIQMGTPERMAHLLYRLRTKGVAHLGTVDGDLGDALGLVIEDVLVIAVRRGLPMDVAVHLCLSAPALN